jgi:hypothetical protein
VVCVVQRSCFTAQNTTRASKTARVDRRGVEKRVKSFSRATYLLYLMGAERIKGINKGSSRDEQRRVLANLSDSILFKEEIIFFLFE